MPKYKLPYQERSKMDGDNRRIRDGTKKHGNDIQSWNSGSWNTLVKRGILGNIQYYPPNSGSVLQTGFRQMGGHILLGW